MATLGWEREFLRAYASVGYQNGGLIGGPRAFVGGRHAAGFRSLRRSPPSTSGKALALAEVVAERPFELFRAGDARLGVAPQGWLAIGNARQSIGAGVFGMARWRTPLENVRINPGHFAQTRNAGHFVYAGLTAAHVFHDDVYRGLMVRAVLPSAVIGVRALSRLARNMKRCSRGRRAGRAAGLRTVFRSRSADGSDGISVPAARSASACFLRVSSEPRRSFSESARNTRAGAPRCGLNPQKRRRRR
jgi:hypothetical protein